MSRDTVNRLPPENQFAITISKAELLANSWSFLKALVGRAMRANPLELFFLRWIMFVVFVFLRHDRVSFVQKRLSRDLSL